MKGWCSIAEMERLGRQRVVDANDWLDALEEAEDRQRHKAQMEQERLSRRNR